MFSEKHNHFTEIRRLANALLYLKNLRWLVCGYIRERFFGLNTLRPLEKPKIYLMYKNDILLFTKNIGDLFSYIKS
jgi:hypothetical protein